MATHRVRHSEEAAAMRARGDRYRAAAEAIARKHGVALRFSGLGAIEAADGAEAALGRFSKELDEATGD